MTTQPTLPRDVTLIHRTNAGSASVVRLTKVGRTYWYCVGLWRNDEEEGGITEGYLARWEKAAYLLVEGAHWDLVQQIRSSHITYQETVKQLAEARDDAKREMVRTWEDRWDRDHPTPRRETNEEIVERWTAARETT